MDLNYYVAVSDDRQLGGTFHTQIACPGIKVSTITELVQITERDGEYYATHRGVKRKVTPCLRCPPELVWKWQHDAACKGTEFDMIEPPDPDDIIKALCSACPVVAECADFALVRSDETTGIWGGVYVPMHGRPRSDALTRLKGKSAMLSNPRYAA